MITFILIFAVGSAEAQPTFPQNVDAPLNIPCTINGAICSVSASCSASVINPKGIVLVNNQNLTQNNGVFTYQLYANQTTENGEYEFPVTCCDAGACGTRHLVFFVTPSGDVGSSGEAITYSIFIFVVLFLLTLCIIGSVKVKSQDEYDIGGNLLKLNYGKYLKMGLFWLCSILLWFLFFLGWQISQKVLYWDFMGTLFKTLFDIFTYLQAPVFIAFVILAIVQWTADLKLWEMAKRGLKQR